MPRSIESAAKAFVESKSFKEAIEAKDYTIIEKQVEEILQEYHRCICIKAVAVYGKVRWCSAQIIKPELRNMEPAKLEYYPKPASSK